MDGSGPSPNHRGRPSDDPRSRFRTDSQGRTIFYPYGQAWSGYVVADAQREEALRNTDTEYRKRDKSLAGFAGIVLVPLMAGLSWLVGGHPLEAIAFGLFLPIGVAIAISYVMPRQAFGDLLVGFERVPCADPAGRRALLYLAIFFAGASLFAWVVLHLYDRRIAELNSGAASTSFYPDISWPIIMFCIPALLLPVLVMKWTRLRQRFRESRMALLALFLAILAAGSALVGVAMFAAPVADVVVARNALLCKWRVEWTQIDTMHGMRDSHGKTTISFTLAAPKSNDASDVGHSRTLRCDVSGLNADASVVYDAIYTAWQSRAAASPGNATQLPIRIGFREDEVIAILGWPPAHIGSQVFHYAYDSETGATNPVAGTADRIVAIHFDAHGRVSRIAEYRWQDGQYFDVVGQRGLDPRDEDYGPITDFGARVLRRN